MREKIFNSIGIGLLAFCFVVSLVRIIALNHKEQSNEHIYLRFAHWQLEDGPREAFNKIANEYMKLHPNVRVEQLLIPERIYPNWLVTQLTGSMAPDLIAISGSVTDEQQARYFVPLSEWAQQPNPYNKGTDLETVPLRQTFFDGMEGGYNQVLLEYFGVPISGFSIRMFYNLDLLEAITGSRELPHSYEALIALCEQITIYAREHKLPITPIAGSKYNAPMLMQQLFSSQTQQLARRITPVGLIEPDSITTADAYLRGDWNMQSPEVHSGFELMREIGRHMPPGFIQLMRDDATLLFAQNRAVMFCSGSWDITSIHQQVQFSLGVSRIPFPSHENPRFGKYTIGQLSEAGTKAGVSFGLTRNSRHPEAAKDFLLFLASQSANQIWADESGWIPSVLGTKPRESVIAFLPVNDGYLNGISATVAEGFQETMRVFSTSYHTLVSPLGSVDALAILLDHEYPSTIIRDIGRFLTRQRGLIQRGDTQMGALAWLYLTNSNGNDTASRRFDIFLQADSFNQQQYYRAKLVRDEKP